MQILCRLHLRLISVCALVCALATCHSPLATAQTGFASISGRVADKSGAVIQKADVALKNLDTGVVLASQTNNDGVYSFPSVQPGNYLMRVQKQGFRSVDVTGLLVYTQDQLARNFSLEVGSASESITVQANTTNDSPAVSLTVSREFVESMPLNGRSFQDLISLAEGTVSTPGGFFSINGQRNDANYYAVDGVSANINPSPINTSNLQGLAGVYPGQTAMGTTQALASVDALQEFKVQTSGYAPEYGRQPGGQVELTTRSGSNELHGSLYDYFRNEALDANDWFANQQGIPRQQERQNDFGGTIGGALRLHKLYDGRNKTFYFVSYEGLRLRLPAFLEQYVATEQFRRLAAPGIQPFLNAGPLPNGPNNGDQCFSSLDPANPAYAFSCSALWSGGYANPSNMDSINIRIDQVIRQRITLFFRYADTPSQVTNLNPPQAAYTAINSHLWTFGATWKLGPSLVNELRLNASKSAANTNGNPSTIGGAIAYARDLLLPTQYAPSGSSYQGVLCICLPTTYVVVPSYFSQGSQSQQFNLVDSVSWTHGGHSFKAGVDFRRTSSEYNPAAYLNFFEILSPQGAQQGFADAGFVYADQLARPTFHNLSFYAEDHWKALARLTVDYGVRWEINPAPGAVNGVYPLAVTTSDLSQLQLAPPGTPVYQSVYHYFAPRVGFAYQLESVKALVLRGGFGIFYDTGQALGAQGYEGYPFSANSSLSNVPIPFPAASLVPPPLNFPLLPPYGFLYLSNPNLTLPYTEQWNLSLDARVNSRNTLTLSYVGNGGKRLLYTQSFQGGTEVNADFSTNGFEYTDNSGFSTYEALQIQDRGYLGPRLQAIASYAFAHAIDNASNDATTLAPERGNSDYDVRRNFNLALNYEIPGDGTSKFVRALTQDWSLTNRFFANSGYPVNLLVGGYALPNGSFYYLRPDLVPGVPMYLHNVPGALGGWALNPAAFTGLVGDGRTPAGTIPVDSKGIPLRQGTLPRNFVRGPTFWSLNSGVQRDFPIREHLRLTFRAEAFNIFNHPNAGNIGKFLYSSTTFGVSTKTPTIGAPTPPDAQQYPLYGTGGARSLQLALKLQF